ncbi:unnamed protein product [Cladocopium goreaui]|uniref:Uncharacterized protein n=1 Tax=Cladocopium goreaui TaxID=2562237 RepID=A0A9P1BQH3_9DINO|nr:unnamed protein product [Cladocopium goreaui]
MPVLGGAMAGTGSLMASQNKELWEKALKSYGQALRQLADRKQDPTKLTTLDDWFFKTEPKKDKAYLVKVMEWKLTRGTFRPGLLQKVELNNDEEVRRCFATAYELLHAETPSSTKALKALTALQGVGPVTASALLCRTFPQHVAYMSDEAVLGSGLVKKASDIKYDMATYTRFNSMVISKAVELGGHWTAEQVARALWAHQKLAAPSSTKPEKGVGKPAAKGVKKSIKKT